MEPQIQYAKTSDGVIIACWTVGEGTPLVHVPLNIGHVQMREVEGSSRRPAPGQNLACTSGVVTLRLNEFSRRLHGSRSCSQG